MVRLLSMTTQKVCKIAAAVFIQNLSYIFKMRFTDILII